MSGGKIISLIRLHIVCGGHMRTCTCVDILRVYVRGRAFNESRLL